MFDNNYLNYQYKQLNHLEALYSHKDNDKVYKISRKQRINIKRATEEEKKEIFSSNTATNLKFPY